MVATNVGGAQFQSSGTVSSLPMVATNVEGESGFTFIHRYIDSVG